MRVPSADQSGWLVAVAAVAPTSITLVCAPLAPSYIIRLYVGVLGSAYTPTYVVPSGFHDANAAFAGVATRVVVATSTSRSSLTSHPPAAATSFVPSCDSAWQPTHLPLAMSGPTNRSAVVCIV